ncbi:MULTISPECIES: ABC transporter permease [unclassified Pseudomonas]|uniref:ABC transporter permease n=1 Tax=unclassified Pseudomonas TaxID=196821 RepID=UPI0021C76645|nr:MULTISPECIES: ABC transporter permease [unclassified Pseudomonas]MCU1731507.1 ABC transporter permease [Pseudomonas sp. 20P_3.2_Bac4]MCU1746574.1 ABC transporter permease [Pseudomonas sp. 20P_3.2_Bac5]
MLLSLEPRTQQSRAMLLLSPLLAGLLTLISGAILFAALGHDPLQTFHTLLIEPISDFYGISELLLKALPILLCAFGLSVAYQARIWNIGAEGQLLMGALAGSALAIHLIDWQSRWALIWVIAAGSLAGALWGGLAAWLRTRFNANEILTTIMLNYIALNLLLFFVHGPLKDPDGFSFPQSAMFGDASRLPALFEDGRVHIGLYFVLLALVAVWVLLHKSFLGFQIKVLGLDQRAAGFVGFREKRLVWLALLISGGLAGLAGVSEVTGPIGQLVPQVSPGYGYAAITVAFLGRLNPFGILAAGLLMALLYLGGENAQMTLNLPQSLTGLFQGMMLFYLLACDVLILYTPRLKLNRRRRAALAETANA